jgi:4-amino-4-deoxy-L-arabinose transferase-like glycosyltransferase
MLSGPALRLVRVVALLLVALKLAHLAFAGVFMDEAYYWMWGQHPALSYFDHPPLNAWLMGLSGALFGWSVFALRLPVALSFAADIWVLWLLSRRIAGEGAEGHFWLTLLLFCATPLFFMVSGYGLPDHVLLTALLFGLYFFHGFFAARARGESGATRDLLWGALCLGLGGLAKYNAAFLGLGVGLFILLYDRALLREGRLWLAALVALALQAPVVVWNLTEGFASWQFILSGRHKGLTASLDGVIGFIFAILILISPFLLWPIGRFALSRITVPGMGFARTTFWVSSVAIVALAFVTATLFHWNIAAYAAMLPFLAFYMRPRWLIAAQAAWGGILTAALFVNYAIVPLTDVEGWRDGATAWSYGWTDVAAAANAARAEHGVGFVAAPDYTTAALLGFAMADPDVTSFAARRDQFDFWFDAAAHAGEDAILYIDRWNRLTEALRARFDSVEEIARFEVVPHGRHVNTQYLYLARGFRPDG